MKKSTSTKSVWSQKDLQEYLAEAVNAYKVGRDWPTVLNMVIKGHRRAKRGVRYLRLIGVVLAAALD
jgi:hypothetical protein